MSGVAATATPLSGHANSFTIFNDRTKLPQTATRTAPTYQPPKLQETTASLANANVPAELGKLITRDVKLLQKLGWKKLVTGRRQRGDFADMRKLQHPAKHLLQHYQSNGVPVMFHNNPWSQEKLDAAMERGPHKSANEHVEFLCEDFLDMIDKSQWIILPYDDVKELKGLRLSLPGVIPQRNRRPRWIGDYTLSEVNQDTVPLAPTDAMQYGKDIAWGQEIENEDGGFKASAESFLFSLKDHAGIGPVKMPIKSDKTDRAVFHNSIVGPSFGGGPDLYVESNANAANSESSSSVGDTYQLPSNTDDPHFLTGSKNFTISEYEVFLV